MPEDYSVTAPIHILVVDDIAQNLIAAEAVLARPGIVVLKASSGAEALELLLTHEVALALIDVQMPQMDGFELAELIRGSERTRSIPLIFLTAASREPSYSFRGYEACAVDFLYKPIDVKARMARMVDQLLDLARIRSGTMELRSSMHDYLALARAIVDEFDTPGQGTVVEVSSVGELHGLCDAGLLSQVISNLLCNAITHGEPGAPVQLALDGRAADSIELRIVNRGVIAAALLPTLFEPFQQAGEKRKSGQGLGLGLYTVNMFVKAHGGTVELSSTATQGTVVTVRIPRQCEVRVQAGVVAK